MGIAAFVFDSNKARNIGTDKDPTLSVSDAMRTCDAFGALKTLHNHPKIDKDRIAVVGFSRGGLISIFSASEKIKQSFPDIQPSFAAHIAVYPVCHVQLEDPDFTRAPILLLLGEKDNITPAQICIDYFPTIEKKGYPIETVIYKGAYHGFTSSGLSGKSIKHPFLSDYMNCIDRPFQLRNDGRWYYPYNDQIFNKYIDWNILTGDCQKKGQGLIGDPSKIRKKCLKDIQDFLKKVFFLDD